MSIPHGFYFDILFFFLAIPLMWPDTAVFTIGKGNYSLGKSQGLLLVGKQVSKGSDVFAILYYTNHDCFILSPLGL